ncbi:MAG TPA: class I SAM-dependent methyltransferase [Streptosporangiaceae bacterium]|jgi:SAM-dependent methyltransferase
MVDNERRKAQAASFGAAASVYERSRPSYPDEAIDWLLPPGARRVLDLGAGTGKLTRGLRDHGLEVMAVEPSEGMRAELSRVLADVTVLAGSAEDIPLDNGTVDAILVAQAWHWVDPARAVPEVARVLRPGGQLGLAWNIRDERVGWVADLGRLMHDDGNPERKSDSDDVSLAPVIGAPFGPTERFDVRWTRETTPAEILELVSSRSYIITMSPTERADVLAQVRELLDTHPDTAGRDEISLPYVTRCWRAQLAH